MEQDYYVKHWAKPCPKYDCRKDSCKCGMKFVSIPAVLGDDSSESDVAPKNGLYCNTIVRYEANGHVYLYSKEGIPTLVSNDSCECKGNLVIELPNGITEYERGKAPISYDEVEEAFEQGRSIFFLDKTFEAEYSIYTVTAFDNTDGIRTIKVEKTGINPYNDGDVGTWIIKSDHSDSWERLTFIPAIPNRITPLKITNSITANWIVPGSNIEMGIEWGEGTIISDNLTFVDTSTSNTLTLSDLFSRLEEGEKFALTIDFDSLAANEEIWGSRDIMGESTVIINNEKSKSATLNTTIYNGYAPYISFSHYDNNWQYGGSSVPVGIGKIDDRYIFVTEVKGYNYT